MELLIQDMQDSQQETLAFSSPDERAKSHADWEWDLEAILGDVFVMNMPDFMKQYS